MKRFRIVLMLAVCLVALSVSGQVESYDSNRGFRHPGGLNTQADFDRIKGQLAAGNVAVVTQEYNNLKNSPFAQPTVQARAVETVVRGGSGSQTYVNAAQDAAKAYQNALRWKIEDNEECAKASVRILMAWAKKHKNFGGDSNYALTVGLQGYQFAQAAELMRDYKGWSKEDFETFRRYMFDVWYSAAINIQRGRLGNWENASFEQPKFGRRPGHSWSNWGLCNTLAVTSIGILCDDPFIYNQGLSYFKYDQTIYTDGEPGLYEEHKNDDILKNWGCTEYIGFLVPRVYDYVGETGAYGKIGQMQESGRDQGHAAMAAALAIDLAHIGWNQGDDLLALMDHRLAAGLEYIAAYNNAKVDDLPFTQYNWHDNGHAFWGAAKTEQKEVSASGRGETRACWGTVIGLYEGVKGVKMPFSEVALKQMGAYTPYTGGASWGYDHLGFSNLLNTRDGIAPADQVPTELTPVIEYEGKELAQSDLGGIENTYVIKTNTCVPKGKTAVLKPQLPEGANDTGNWDWNTGEKTRNITITTDKSFLYRVTYTNENGIKSEQVFSVAVEGDNTPVAALKASIYRGDECLGDSAASAYKGNALELRLEGNTAWGEIEWSTGEKGSPLKIESLTSSQEIVGQFTAQDGSKQTVTFRINLMDDAFVDLPAGDYAIYDVDKETYLTNNGETENVSFKPLQGSEEKMDDSQVWTFAPKTAGQVVKYDFISKVGGEKAYLSVNGNMVKKTYQPFYIRGLVDSDNKAIRTLTKDEYWVVDEDGTLNMKGATVLTAFPFLIVPVKDGQLTDVKKVELDSDDAVVSVEYYTLSGAKINKMASGVNVVKFTTRSGKVIVKKIIV